MLTKRLDGTLSCAYFSNVDLVRDTSATDVMNFILTGWNGYDSGI